MRAVHGIERQIDEKRLAGPLRDKTPALGKEDVRAVAVDLLGQTVSIVGVIEIVVSDRVSDFVDAACKVPNDNW